MKGTWCGGIYMHKVVLKNYPHKNDLNCQVQHKWQLHTCRLILPRHFVSIISVSLELPTCIHMCVCMCVPVDRMI